MRTYCSATDPPHMVPVKPIPGTMRYDARDLICPEHPGTPLKTKGDLKPRTPLKRVSEKREGQVCKQRSTLKPGKGFSASKAQREKVRGLPCVGCGREAGKFVSIDPAHLTARGVGGCNDALCVVPLCREYDGLGCHRRFDNRDLDLLSKLIDNGYFPELAHAIEAHELSPLTLLERTTGQEWQPVTEQVVG